MSFLPLCTLSAMNTNQKRVPWKLYPIDDYKNLLRIHGNNNVKLFHVVRHAEGTHNINKEYKDPINKDARLTSKGKDQCKNLAKKIEANTIPYLSFNAIDDVCVFTSPMTRCIETSILSFPWIVENSNLSFIAHESLRETVNFVCDQRRPIQEIADEFPRVDFSMCQQDHDFIWEKYQKRLSDNWETHMESSELYVVANRAHEIFSLLEKRSESQIVICTHSAFLRCILNWGQKGVSYCREPQVLDERENKVNYKLFEYNGDSSFENYMRKDFENCELRSFCMLIENN